MRVVWPFWALTGIRSLAVFLFLLPHGKLVDQFFLGDFYGMKLKRLGNIFSSVADLYVFYSNPDPTSHFEPDPGF